MLTILISYCICGVFVGLLAGMLGLGGGVIIVPLLNVMFAWQGFSEDIIQHMALGTSMASILFTSISSVRAHYMHGHVDWSIWKTISPGIIIGTFGGAMIASYIPTKELKIFFVVFLIIVGTQMLYKYKPKPSRHLPKPLWVSLIGSFVGVISSLVGIGGATMTVPFMTFCNVPIRQAIGTAAAIGFSIALAGSFGYIVSEVAHSEALPPWAIGYVYLPALVSLVIPSMLVAPLGARIASVLPTDRLKQFLGLFTYTMALHMLWTIW